MRTATAFGALDMDTGESWDVQAGIYLRRDEAGTVVEQRPLSAEETASLAPAVVVDHVPEARAAIAAATTVAGLRAASLKLIDALGGGAL